MKVKWCWFFSSTAEVLFSYFLSSFEILNVFISLFCAEIPWCLYTYLLLSASIRTRFWINNLVLEDSKEGVTKTQSITDNQGLEQKKWKYINNVEKTPEQTQSSNTSGKGSTKTPGFEAVCGIVSMLAVFLHKRK